MDRLNPGFAICLLRLSAKNFSSTMKRLTPPSLFHGQKGIGRLTWQRILTFKCSGSQSKTVRTAIKATFGTTVIATIEQQFPASDK
jgi:hypothetical protein